MKVAPFRGGGIRRESLQAGDKLFMRGQIRAGFECPDAIQSGILLKIRLKDELT